MSSGWTRPQRRPAQVCRHSHSHEQRDSMGGLRAGRAWLQAGNGLAAKNYSQKAMNVFIKNDQVLVEALHQ